jgi:hypothetical protein
MKQSGDAKRISLWLVGAFILNLALIVIDLFAIFNTSGWIYLRFSFNIFMYFLGYLTLILPLSMFFFSIAPLTQFFSYLKALKQSSNSLIERRKNSFLVIFIIFLILNLLFIILEIYIGAFNAPSKNIHL